MKLVYSFLITFLVITYSCSSNKATSNASQSSEPFKVVGYYYYVPGVPAAEDLDVTGLTHINYSFAIPQKEGYGLEQLSNTQNLEQRVTIAHSKGKKVFISLGGWNLGDGGGNDYRSIESPPPNKVGKLLSKT